MSIVIKTEKDINRLETKIGQVEIQYPAFLVSTLTTILNQEIIDEIHNKMRSENISQKIIDTTFLSTQAKKSEKSIIFVVISNFVSDSGFPVARMIENGRKAYIIKAPEPTAERPNPHLTPIIEGQRKFFKQAKIPVMPARKIIQKTINRKTTKVQNRLNRETKRWFKEILRS